MNAWKDTVKKSSFKKNIAVIQSEKRQVEERLWNSYRESDAREKDLRQRLSECQSEYASLETINESLASSLKKDQRANYMLAKNVEKYEKERKSYLESKSSQDAHNYTIGEFVHVLTEKTRIQQENEELRASLQRIQAASQNKVPLH